MTSATVYLPKKKTERLIVPHENGQIAFAHPLVGGSYLQMGEKVLEAGQTLPRALYTASLLHAAYCNPEFTNEAAFQRIRNIMRNSWLWTFDIETHTENGVYVWRDSNLLKGEIPNTSQLENALKGGIEINGIRFDRHSWVRFAPKGSYSFGEHTAESLAKDGLVIARYGINGAEKLAEVAFTFPENPRVDGIDIDHRITKLIKDTGMNGIKAERIRDSLSKLAMMPNKISGNNYLLLGGNGWPSELGGSACGVLNSG